MKKRTPMQRIRRWKKRMVRRYSWATLAFAIGEAAAGCLLVVLVLALILRAAHSGDDTGIDQRAEAQARLAAADVTEAPAEEITAQPESVPEITPEPEPTVPELATMEPTPEPRYIDGVREDYYCQTAAPGAEYSDPYKNGLTAWQAYVGTKAAGSYQRAEAICAAPSVEYNQVEGVTTFRGTDYRDGGAYGTIPENPTSLSIVWSQRIGGLDDWSGVGWTGQASLVRWTAAQRQMMNIVPEKQAKDGLIEGIYATLDGHIYFFDLEDGVPTRNPINIGAPVKGSVSVDPRGLPLLYCGQGIYDVGGKRVKCGTRIWSLIDQSLLYMIDGSDSVAIRKWQAFDGSPLVDAATDTLIQAGENGVLYTVKLNSSLSGGTMTINPEVDRMVYRQSLDGQVGSENSVVMYGNYVYFGNNTGIIQCVDLNTMSTVWSFYAQDDIDATMVIEVEPDGSVGLYAANEQDKRGSNGKSQMFKLNALTGELLWCRDSDPISQNDENGGGSFATPAVGKNSLSDLVYFHVCRTVDSRGMLYALDKNTGEIIWSHAMGSYGWSSPTCVYTPSGAGYVLVGSSNGMLRLFDGRTGQIVAAADLEANIEGSPAVFDDMLVVGTRGAKIYGVRIG